MNKQRKHYFDLIFEFLPVSAEETGRNCFFQAGKKKKNLLKKITFFPALEETGKPWYDKIFSESAINLKKKKNNFWRDYNPYKYTNIPCKGLSWMGYGL